MHAMAYTVGGGNAFRPIACWSILAQPRLGLPTRTG